VIIIAVMVMMVVVVVLIVVVVIVVVVGMGCDGHHYSPDKKKWNAIGSWDGLVLVVFYQWY